MAKKQVNLPRGEGTFTQRANGTYELKKIIHVANGTKRVSVYGKTQQICMEKMKAKEKEIKEQCSFHSDMLLADGLLDWVKNIHNQTVKRQTQDRLIRTANKIGNTDLGHKFVHEIDSREIQDYIQSLVDARYSHSTIKKSYDLLNAYYRYASEYYGFKNPMNLVEMPSVNNVKVETRQIEWFEQSDVDKFIEAVGTKFSTGRLKFKYGYALAANIYLGMRGGELLALQWKDVDFENGTVYVCKTLIEEREEGKTKFVVQESTKRDKNRYIPINSKARDLLLKHKEAAEFTEPDDYVISTSNRKTNTIKNLSDMIKAIEDEADTEVKACNTHILRHTCASLYFRAGVPIEIICTILGNTREVCEKTYIHFVEEQLKDAANKTIKAIEI